MPGIMQYAEGAESRHQSLVTPSDCAEATLAVSRCPPRVLLPGARTLLHFPWCAGIAAQLVPPYHHNLHWMIMDGILDGH